MFYGVTGKRYVSRKRFSKGKREKTNGGVRKMAPPEGRKKERKGKGLKVEIAT